MNSTYLVLAGICEIGWVIGLRQMDNHKNLLCTVIFYVSIITGFYFLQRALKVIPIGKRPMRFTQVLVPLEQSLLGCASLKNQFRF